MLSCFKKKVEESEISPVDGRREHFFRVFDNKYGFMLSFNLTTVDSYNLVRSFYADNQETLYQSILSYVAENGS